MRYLLIKNGKVIRDGGIFNEDLLILENRISEVAFQVGTPEKLHMYRCGRTNLYVSLGIHRSAPARRRRL